MQPPRSRLASALINAALVLGSVAFCLLATELFFRAYGAVHASAVAATPPPPSAVPPPDPGADIAVPASILLYAAQRHALLTLPAEWEMTQVTVPGASSAYTWQGVLHVMNTHFMRWTTPFPDKRPDTFRVLVVGDSLTYGAGMAEQGTFTARLNQWMGGDYRIEFLNLGMTGGTSSDMLNNLKELMPQLKPDLIIYAMCLNDFLHPGQGEYRSYDYAFPFPEPVQRFLISHTQTGAFVAALYDRALRRFHLRRDFYDDILAGFGGYQQRFRRDVAEMNAIVRAAGLPAIIAMVVDQFPEYRGRGYAIAQAAEHAFREAGIDYIPTEDYYRRYDGQRMYVSRWEGHPDEVANYIWAAMLMRKLLELPDVQQRKSVDQR